MELGTPFCVETFVLLLSENVIADPRAQSLLFAVFHCSLCSVPERSMAHVTQGFHSNSFPMEISFCRRGAQSSCERKSRRHFRPRLETSTRNKSAPRGVPALLAFQRATPVAGAQRIQELEPCSP